MIGSIVDAKTNNQLVRLEDDGWWGGPLGYYGVTADRQLSDWRPADGDPIGLLNLVAETIRERLPDLDPKVVPSPETAARLRREETADPVVIH